MKYFTIKRKNSNLEFSEIIKSTENGVDEFDN